MHIVIRKTPKGTWIQESVKFKDLNRANNWREFIALNHPKDKVFVVVMVEDM